MEVTRDVSYINVTTHTEEREKMLVPRMEAFICVYSSRVVGPLGFSFLCFGHLL